MEGDRMGVGRNLDLEKRDWDGIMCVWGYAGTVDHLFLRDPRLLLAVPLAVVETHSIPVKEVQIVDSHLQDKEARSMACTRLCRNGSFS